MELSILVFQNVHDFLKYIHPLKVAMVPHSMERGDFEQNILKCTNVVYYRSRNYTQFHGMG
jgi:hypothetical protein